MGITETYSSKKTASAPVSEQVKAMMFREALLSLVSDHREKQMPCPARIEIMQIEGPDGSLDIVLRCVYGKAP